MPERHNPAPEDLRDNLASEIRGIRRDRDEKRGAAEKAKTSPRIDAVKNRFNLKGGSRELEKQASFQNRQSRVVLEEGKVGLPKNRESVDDQNKEDQEPQIRKFSPEEDELSAESYRILDKLDEFSSWYMEIKYFGARGINEQEVREKLQFLADIKNKMGTLREGVSRIGGYLTGHARGVILRLAEIYNEGDDHPKDIPSASMIDTSVKNIILQFEEENYRAVKKDIEAPKMDERVVLNSLKNLLFLFKGDELQQRLANALLKQELPKLKEVIDNKNSDYEALNVVGEILEYGDADLVNQASDILDDVKGLIKRTELGYGFSNLLTRTDRPRAREATKKAAAKYLEDTGLDAEVMFQAWKDSDSTDAGESIYENLRSIIKLENKIPGATKFLVKEFGIRDFARYPIEILESQVLNAQQKEKPYGVVIYPRSDWNGSFYSQASSKEVLLSLYEQTEFKYHLRVFECEDKVEIAKVFRKLKNSYSPHKISFAIIGGHGTKDSIDFGGKDEKHTLRAEDLTDPRAKNKNTLFEPGCTIILASCSTGTEGGIAQKLSGVLNVRVRAPKLPTSMESIQADITKSGISLKVQYHKVYGHEDTVDKTYLSGKESGIQNL